MSLNTAQLEYLSEMGLSLADVVELSRLGDGEPSSAAVRQKRYRDKKRNERDATRDVTPPPIEDHTPPSEAKASVAEATGGEQIDPAKQLFDLGIELMMRTEAMTEKQARNYIGGLRKDHGELSALQAVIEARMKNISRPVEWLPKRCKAHGPPSGNLDQLFKSANKFNQVAA